MCMSRNTMVSDRARLNVFILRAQAIQIEKYAELYNRTKTEVVEEALQYWINEQTRLYGDKLSEICKES